jgi:hypothetical protein
MNPLLKKSLILLGVAVVILFLGSNVNPFENYAIVNWIGAGIIGGVFTNLWLNRTKLSEEK